eukprot:8693766-Pyramimonas_sp.AAC.1
MQAAYRDYMDWCVDWALHQIHQLMHITMEMAPQGLRNLAYDLCRTSWDSISELRDSTCERLPHGVRPTWLWTERRTSTDYRPTNDRAPSSGLQVNYEELEETVAYA